MSADPRGSVRNALTTNLSYKGLALVIAVLLWVTVQSEQVVEDRARIRLEWTLPEGLTLVEPPLENATATVEGVQAFIRGVRQKELSMMLDLSKAQEGEVTLDLLERAVAGMPPQVRVVSLSPSTLKVQLDRVLRRRVTVLPVTRGVPAHGYRVGRISVTPDRVELSGPSSVLRAVNEVATDIVDVSGLLEDAELSVALDLRNGQLAPTAAGAFVVSVRVEPIMEERTFDGVMIEIDGAGILADGATTARVVVEGELVALEGMTAGDFRLRVHVPPGTPLPAEARRRADGLRYELIRPEGASLEVIDVTPAVFRVARP